jgi:hypothetical protein
MHQETFSQTWWIKLGDSLIQEPYLVRIKTLRHLLIIIGTPLGNIPIYFSSSMCNGLDETAHFYYVHGERKGNMSRHIHLSEY